MSIGSKLRKMREEGRKRKKYYKEEYQKYKHEAQEKAKKRGRQQISSKAKKAAYGKYDVTPSERSEYRRKQLSNLSKNLNTGGCFDLSSFNIDNVLPDFDNMFGMNTKSKRRK